MKRIFFTTGILTGTILILTSFSTIENQQDPPRMKKKKKHVNLVKVDGDGNVTRLDTVLTDRDFFVWNGDTIDGLNKLKWLSDEDFNFDFDFNADSENVFVMKHLKHGMPMIYEFRSKGDSTKNIRIKIPGDELPGIPHPPLPPMPPHVPRIFHFEKDANVIDLSDPGIISFKKKDLSGDREKIIIIRDKSEENGEGQREEIIIGGRGMHPPFEVNNDENIRVPEKNGKVVRIKEKKENGKKNVEVETEDEREN